jgi:hypothetical protein
MTNEIQKVREEIRQQLLSARICPEERTVELSPCGRYQLEVGVYAEVSRPEDASLALAVVRSVATGEVVATVGRNDDRLFYAWVSRDGQDYLLFPEDLLGQTVINLTTRQVAGYSTPDGDFIWTEFYPSPDRNCLAVVGCYWACPFVVIVYDFRDPMNLPLPILAEFEFPNGEEFGEWTSMNSFSTGKEKEHIHVFALP